MADNVTKALLEELGAYLKRAIPRLKSVSYEWPNPNVALQYPCATITATEPIFSNMMPQELSRGSTVNNKSLTRYEVGQYDFSVYIDLWCGNKEERFRLYDELFNAINLDVEVMGLSLPLQKYYGVFARYDLVGYDFNDGEEPAQRAEWRARLSVKATCKAILEKPQFIITKPIESTAEVVDNEIAVE